MVSNAASFPTGYRLAELSQGSDRLKEFGLAKNRYVIIVSRLVPEKRHLDLIEAFKLANLERVETGDRRHFGSSKRLYAECHRNFEENGECSF
jgi:glycosyltransferase involved in cell wall biosynthesis